MDAANREAVEAVTELEAALTRHRDEAGRLTAASRRLIEAMKQADLLAEDSKEEYRWLVREKERLQTQGETLELDSERRRKRVLDAELIRRGLQDFERLVGLLPLEDQKELVQLLVREVVVSPFEPERETRQEAPPAVAQRPRRPRRDGRDSHRAALHSKNPHPVVPRADQSLSAPRPAEPREC